jgi:ferredoxin
VAVVDSPVLLDVGGLQAVVDVLHADGREVIGPRARAGVVQTGPLRHVDELPVGWHDQQAPGRYRLHDGAGPARFGWAVGPQTWKPLLHPPRVRTVTVRRRRDAAPGPDRGTSGPVTGLDVRPEPTPERRLALFGLRPCDLAAIARLDRVLLGGIGPEPVYEANRRDAFLVVVECTSPADTCFCPSMGTGPGVPADAARHDLAMTELVSGDDVRYLARAGSDEGARVLREVVQRAGAPTAGPDVVAEAEHVVRAAAASIHRELDGRGLPDALVAAHDHPEWDDVAARCLACGNCTAVGPTCFCTDLRDVTDLSGAEVERWRTWATCFDPEFSRLGARRVRASTSSRYRQWLTHKLATWHDQFGESGCVGCGRCITWCPVGIDLVREATVLRTEQRAVVDDGGTAWMP